MTLKRNKTDLLILILSILLIGIIIVISNVITGKVDGNNKYVVVSIDGEEKFKYKLSEDREINLLKDDYSTLLGDMTIEIKDNKVRVKKEESPKNYCSKQGWVGNVATPIFCLPNAVVITIIGENASDLDWQVERWNPRIN